jgi:hypothetical protein
MDYQHRCRSGRHVIRDHRDRRANGGCAACARINERNYKMSCRAAKRRLAALESLLSA